MCKIENRDIFIGQLQISHLCPSFPATAVHHIDQDCNILQQQLHFRKSASLRSTERLWSSTWHPELQRNLPVSKQLRFLLAVIKTNTSSRFHRCCSVLRGKIASWFSIKHFFTQKPACSAENSEVRVNFYRLRLRFWPLTLLCSLLTLFVVIFVEVVSSYY